MDYEWDGNKNQTNFAKHGFYLTDGKYALEDPHSKTELDNRWNYGEERFKTIGRFNQTIIVAVVYTDRNDTIRIISVRRATKTERRVYNGNN
jgi:uncharacterized DUF497 family protein